MEGWIYRAARTLCSKLERVALAKQRSAFHRLMWIEDAGAAKAQLTHWLHRAALDKGSKLWAHPGLLGGFPGVHLEGLHARKQLVDERDAAVRVRQHVALQVGQLVDEDEGDRGRHHKHSQSHKDRHPEEDILHWVSACPLGASIYQ